MLIDLRHLVRSLRRSPATAVAAAFSLALTLGAGASIFAVVDAVLLTPPPFADPDRLVVVGEVPAADPGAAPRAVGYATFEAWRERASALAAIEAFDGTNVTLTALGPAERVSASNVTPGFLTLLGVSPTMGRSFAPDDVGQAVVVVSHGFWHTRLAGDPQAIGRRLVLGGQPHTIVGILPESFAFALNPCDLWRPFPVAPARAAQEGYRVNAVVRLRRNVSVAHFEDALEEVSRTSSPPARVRATRIDTAIAGRATGTLLVLASAAALAAVIAFVNLAGLLLVRSIDRRRELAVRRALGASRSDIVRQLILEAGAIVAAGSAAGVLLALWLTPLVGRLALAEFGRVANREVTIGWRAIAVVFAVAAACACLCALLPALSSTRHRTVDALRRGVTPPPRERTLRHVFVSAEVALAFVLVASMTLVGRSLFAILAVDPGFEASGVLALQVSLPPAYTDERTSSFYSTLQRALEQRLGRGAAATVDEIPLTGDRGRRLVSVAPTDVGREAVARTASRGYFAVMRIPVIAGRPFDGADDASVVPRVVLSASLARTLFASVEDAIGREVRMGLVPQAQVVGVVGDVRHGSLDERRLPTVYLSASRFPSRSSVLVLRAGRPDADVMAAVREEVARLDRDLPVYGTRSMLDVVAASPGVPARRVLTSAFVGFALLAVVLGAIGLFGAVAHDVARRRAELAIRIALGADFRRILTSTLGQGAGMIGAGLAAGCALSIAAARAVGALLLRADGIDVPSVGAAAVVLTAVGFVSILPAALRAARTDPIVALRE